MENLSVRSETPTAVRVDLGAIFVSLELSKSTWLVTSLTPGSDKMSRHSVVGGDTAERHGENAVILTVMLCARDGEIGP